MAENRADIEAMKYLELQKKLSSKLRAFDLILVCFISAIVIGFGVSIFFLPQTDFSELENKPLASFPTFSAESLASGEFTSGIGDFYSDRFPLRSFFLEVKAESELLQNKGQNNAVIKNSDGSLVKRLEYTDYSCLDRNLASIDVFSKRMNEEGVKVYFAVPPRSCDVMKNACPELYGGTRADVVWDRLSSYDENSRILLDALKKHFDGGEYVWYNTDHHWTTMGAYVAYSALGGILGYDPYKEDYFTKELVSQEFYGTTYSASGMFSAKPDEMYYYRYPGDDGYIVENRRTGKLINGFYDREFLGVKDKYSSFLGGNEARQSIYKYGEKRDTLVIVKDSYSHSLVPFLSLHYDIELVDLRTYNGSTAELVRETGAKRVLIMIGADTLATSAILPALALGLNK